MSTSIHNGAMNLRALSIGLLVYLVLNVLAGTLAFVLFPRIIEQEAFWVSRFSNYLYLSSAVIAFASCWVTAVSHPSTWIGNILVIAVVNAIVAAFCLKIDDFQKWIENTMVVQVILSCLFGGWLGSKRSKKTNVAS